VPPRSGRRARRSGALALGPASGVNSVRLNTAVIRTALHSGRVSSVTSAVSDSSEQQLSGSIDEEGSTIDSDDCAASSVLDRQQSPSPFIEQWPSLMTTGDAVRHPVRQFKPPHQSKITKAARRLTHSPICEGRFRMARILAARSTLSPAISSPPQRSPASASN